LLDVGVSAVLEGRELFTLRWLSRNAADESPLMGVAYMPNRRRVAAFLGVGRTANFPSLSNATPMYRRFLCRLGSW
jgi:hypothetical protein